MQAILAPRGGRLVAVLLVLTGLLGTAASARAFFPPQTGGTGTPPTVTPSTPPPEVTPPPTIPPVVTPPPVISGGGTPPPVTAEEAPEPATLLMGAVGSGLAGLYAAYRRRRAAAEI
jgi:hypothetical protein